MAVFTMPLLVAVQSMSARIGAVKDEGLGHVIEERFGRPWLLASIAVLVTANIATIAADLGGIAAGVHLLIPVPVKVVIPLVGLGLLAVEVLWSYRRFATILKWLTLVLGLYILSGFAARPDWGQVLEGTFVPHLSLSTEFLSTAVAILGTTISPYMFFWITSQEAQEDLERDGPDLDDDPLTSPAAERARRCLPPRRALPLERRTQRVATRSPSLLHRHRRRDPPGRRRQLSWHRPSPRAHLRRSPSGLPRTVPDPDRHHDRRRPHRHGRTPQRLVRHHLRPARRRRHDSSSHQPGSGQSHRLT